MLIKRTIRNPVEKLYLFLKFIRDNQLSNDLFIIPENGIFKEVWVKQSIILDALKVKPQVFKSWFKNGCFGRMVVETHFGNIMRDDHRSSYVLMALLANFLMKQYNMAEENKNSDNAQKPNMYKLYLNMDDLK